MCGMFRSLSGAACSDIHQVRQSCSGTRQVQSELGLLWMHIMLEYGQDCVVMSPSARRGKHIFSRRVTG